MSVDRHSVGQHHVFQYHFFGSADGLCRRSFGGHFGSLKFYRCNQIHTFLDRTFPLTIFLLYSGSINIAHSSATLTLATGAYASPILFTAYGDLRIASASVTGTVSVNITDTPAGDTVTVDVLTSAGAFTGSIVNSGSPQAPIQLRASAGATLAGVLNTTGPVSFASNGAVRTAVNYLDPLPPVVPPSVFSLSSTATGAISSVVRVFSSTTRLVVGPVTGSVLRKHPSYLR
jgi:hypothetical protein